MSPEEARAIMHRGVYTSAVQIANQLTTVPNHHHVCVQNICYAIFGSEWYNYTHEEQCAKRTIIEQAYNRMLKDFLPVLQHFQQDTNEVLRLDDATLASLFRRTIHTNTSTTKTSAMETSDAFDKSTAEEPANGDMDGEEILNTQVAIDRDQAARKNLVKYYEPCQQGRKDLMIRRAKEPEGNIGLFNHQDIPLNDDKKTKNCPTCGKSISLYAIKRHYQITHAKDPRWVIYCPASGCKFECWRGDATIKGHMSYHHEDLHREIFGQEDVQKEAEARQKARDRINARSWAKINAKAIGSKSGISEGHERKIEQTKLPEALDQDDIYNDEEDEYEAEDVDEEHMYDEIPHNEHRLNQRTPEQHMSDQYVSNQYTGMHNQPMANQHMVVQHMANQHTPNPYMPDQHMANPYIFNPYIPYPHMANPNMPVQHVVPQHTVNRFMFNQHRPSQEMQDQYGSNEHAKK